MGLIRNTIGSALGGDKVKTGFGGPQLPFVNNMKISKSQNQGAQASSPSPPPYESLRPHSNMAMTNGYSDRLYDRKRTPEQNIYQPSAYDDDYFDAHYDSCQQDSAFSSELSPYAYGSSMNTSNHTQRQHVRDLQYRNIEPPNRSYRSRNDRFRPLAVPQIAYGEAQPFLRAYSDELWSRGISEEVMISTLDKINAAVIPSPEVQIFQKGASIAGWFVPGAAALGLIGGQVVVGVGAAFGHASMVSRALAKANLNIFLPHGLEICIAKSKHIDAEVGYLSNQQDTINMSPEARIASYGESIAPLTTVLPPLEKVGRQDPIAMLGRGIGNQATKKKVDRANKSLTKGKNEKVLKLEEGLTWLMVREASPDTLAHWQKILKQSEAALQEERDFRESRR